MVVEPPEPPDAEVPPVPLPPLPPVVLPPLPPVTLPPLPPVSFPPAPPVWLPAAPPDWLPPLPPEWLRRPPKTRRSLLFQHGRQRWGYRRCQRRRPSSLPGLARRRWRKTRRSERKNGVVAIASRAAPSIVQTMSTRKSARRASIAQFDRWTRHSFWYFIEARGIVRTPSVREFKEYKLSLKYGLPVVLFIRRAQALGIMAVFTRGFCFMRQVL